MKRRLVFETFMAVVLATIVSAACVTPAFAVTTTTDHLSTNGIAYIDVPGHPEIMITFAHFDWGDHGSGNSIGIWEWFPPLGTMMIVAWIRNTESQYNWAKELVKFLPVVTQQVRCYQLQVYRIGKIATAIWTFPIVVPEEKWVSPMGTYYTPAVTIPPGCLLLKGVDGVKTGTVIFGPFPSGWALTQDWTGFDACATFICPSWHYCGPVGSVSVNSVYIDSTQTATHP